MAYRSSIKRTIFLVVAQVMTAQFFLPRHSRFPTMTRPAFAGGVAVANEEAETVFTASEDGKTIYMWQVFHSKPPKFLGKSEAILHEK